VFMCINKQEKSYRITLQMKHISTRHSQIIPTTLKCIYVTDCMLMQVQRSVTRHMLFLTRGWTAHFIPTTFL